jgi:hypothetical protein
VSPPAPLGREQELGREQLGRAELGRGDLSRAELGGVPWTPRSIHRRRAHAARARRRRLLLVDLAVGLVIALAAVLVGPGLAIVAIGALPVLGVCGASLLYERLARRRGARGERGRG